MKIHILYSSLITLYLMINSFLAGIVYSDTISVDSNFTLIRKILSIILLILFFIPINICQFIVASLIWLFETLQVRFWWSYLIKGNHKTFDEEKMIRLNQWLKSYKNFKKTSLAHKHMAWIANMLNKKFNYTYKEDKN